MKNIYLSMAITLFLFIGFSNNTFSQSITVSGAGSVIVDGNYPLSAYTPGGKVCYIRGDGYTIMWESDRWVIIDGPGTNRYYYNTNNTTFPPNVGWQVGADGTVPAPVAGGSITSLLVGNGTIGSPYQISSLNSLYWIALNSAEWGKYFVQTANIDASETSTWTGGAGWTPIGNWTTYFTGSYNGNMFTIDGLFINRTASDCQGLFGVIFGGEVDNLGLTDVNISGKNNVGAVTGYLYNVSEMSNCYSSGSVSGTSYVGGLLSNIGNYSTVSNCYSTCTVTASSQCGGGLLGRADQSTIENCYASGTVTANEYCGGLTGFLYGSTVTHCYSSGTVLGGFSLGGLNGANNTSTVTNSFWDTETSGNSSSSGGTGLTTTIMKTQTTYTDAEWGFGTIWEMIGTNYPRLINIPEGALPVELMTFTAALHGKSVELKWNTATEVNNVGFEVERKIINNEQLTMNNWSKIGFVEGNGTTHAQHAYSFVDANAVGKTSYRLKQIDRDGKFEYSNVVEVTVSGITSFGLDQNYPNPFNPTTTISYQLSSNSFTTLKVYDAIGREVASLVNEMKEAGTYSATFDGSKLSSGIYFYILRSGNFTLTKKLTLMK